MKKYLLFLTVLFVSNVILAQQTITLEEVWGADYSKKFQMEGVYGIRSTADGLHYTTMFFDRETKEQQIQKHSYAGTRTPIIPLFSNKDFKTESGDPFYFDDYSFSADEKKILLATDEESIYRHSSKAHYYIYDIESKKLEKLTKGKKQLFATFSPAGSHVAYVQDNNLFVKSLMENHVVQITNDGKYNEIINGRTDWVYEEEFAFDKAFFWSPNGNQIAFYKFNESEVKQFSMPMYGSLYPSQYTFKYPKAGEKNATVEIHVHDLRYGTSKHVNIGDETDQYIPRLKWSKKNETLIVYRMNRHQNKLELLKVNTNFPPKSLRLNSEVMMTETSDTYIDITDDIRFLDDEKSFIWTSDQSGYRHIYLYNLDGKMVRQITKGDWDVTQFYGIDKDGKNLFFQAAKTAPHQREIYKTDIRGSKTMMLSKKAGWNTARFSNGMNFFINTYSNANTANYITLLNNKGEEVKVLKTNEAYNRALADHQFQPKEFTTITTEDNIELPAWIIKPKNFDASKKYPVFMFVYGGPGSQEVVDNFAGREYLWHQYLSQQGYLVACVDGRGTGAKGAEFQKCTYQELGKLETIDQINAAKVIGTWDYVDANRIGIMGWSYGGYMTSLCMTKGADVFKAGIAVAPVTNWRYYDSIYTERYMRTPQENASGYDDNSPINHVEKLKGAYLLVHGSADDNVHYQNTMEMITALVDANKQFDLFIYPNKNHGIYGGNTRLHLFTKMYNFLEDNLKN